MLRRRERSAPHILHAARPAVAGRGRSSPVAAVCSWWRRVGADRREPASEPAVTTPSRARPTGQRLAGRRLASKRLEGRDLRSQAWPGRRFDAPPRRAAASSAGAPSLCDLRAWSEGERRRRGFCSPEWPGPCWLSARSRRRLGPPPRGRRRSNRDSLARAQTIRAQLDARYRVMRGRGLAVTEATSTGVVESFTLLTFDLLETRLLPGRQRDLLRNLPSACYLSLPGPPLRASGGGARSPPAGARARAPHVSGDVGRRRRRLASHARASPSSVVQREELAREVGSARPWRRRSTSTPRTPSPHRSRRSSIGSPALGST